MRVDISFIIPAFNEEALIARCVDSIQKELARSGKSGEIIVVNNASTDRTHEIAAAIRGVTVVDEPRKGTNSARQRGFETSTGALVANIDADCMLVPGWLDIVFVEFQKNPRLIALGGPYRYEGLGAFAHAMTVFFQFSMFIAYLFNRFVIRKSSQLLGGNCVIRRSALEAIGGYDTSFTFFGDDNNTARRLSKLGPVKWTYRLEVYSSGRRFANDGVFKTAYTYLTAFFTANYGQLQRDRSEIRREAS